MMQSEFTCTTMADQTVRTCRLKYSLRCQKGTFSHVATNMSDGIMILLIAMYAIDLHTPKRALLR